MIIEADITNPATAGWTQPWNATSYDNKEIDNTKIIDGLPFFSFKFSKNFFFMFKFFKNIFKKFCNKFSLISQCRR